MIQHSNEFLLREFVRLTYSRSNGSTDDSTVEKWNELYNTILERMRNEQSETL